MGLYLTLSGEYARRIMVGTVGKLVATQPLNSGGQLCIGATTSSRASAGIFVRTRMFLPRLCFFRLFLEINDGLNNDRRSADRHLGIYELSLSKILASMLFRPVSRSSVCYCAGSVLYSARAVAKPRHPLVYLSS